MTTKKPTVLAHGRQERRCGLKMTKNIPQRYYSMRKQKSQEANGHRLFAVVLGVVTFAAIIALAKQKYNPTPTGEMEHVVVTVREGDTPWDIARRYCPDGVDIRDYLGWVEDANGITFDEPIMPGQRLIFFEEVDG